MSINFDWLDTLVGIWVGAILGIAAISIVRMARD